MRLATVFLLLVLVLIQLALAGQGKSKPKLPKPAFELSDNTPKTNQMINFDASLSSGSGKKVPIIKVVWNFGDGQTATGFKSNHQYTASGSYLLILTVTDRRGKTGQLQKTITISQPNQPPVVAISGLSKVKTKEPLILSANATDPDGIIQDFRWQASNGQTASSQTVSLTFDRPGSYTVSLAVTDDDGALAIQSQDVTVDNRPPIANFTYSPSRPQSLDRVTLTDQSSDPDTAIATRQWQFPDGSQSTGTIVYYKFNRSGWNQVTLTVTDSYDQSTDSKTNNIWVDNRPPIARFKYNQYNAKIGDSVMLDAGESFDPDGTIVEATIDAGDGAIYSGLSAIHIYTTIGQKTARVTVKDNLGATATDSVTIPVSPGPRLPKPPGHTEFKLLGPSSPPKTLVLSTILPYSFVKMIIDDEGNLWTNSFTKIALPSGQTVLGPIDVHNNNDFTFDIFRDSLWFAGFPSTPARIHKYSLTGQLLKTLSIGYFGSEVIGNDLDNFLYFMTGIDPNNPAANGTFMIDLANDNLVRYNDRPVYWTSNFGAPGTAIIPDGINLWEIYDGFPIARSKIVHFDRITGEIIHQLFTSSSGPFTIGPNHEIIQADYTNRLVAYDPQDTDDKNPLWTLQLPDYAVQLYCRNGILAISLDNNLSVSTLQVWHF